MMAVDPWLPSRSRWLEVSDSTFALCVGPAGAVAAAAARAAAMRSMR